MIKNLIIFVFSIWVQALALETGYGACGVKDVKLIKRETIEGSHPWLAVIVNKTNSNYMCGATVINNNTVVTVGHCLKRFKADDISILAGTSNLAITPQRYEVEKFVIHNSYDPKHFENDIGLVTINGVFKWSSKLSPICLPTSNSNQHNNCQVAEWIPQDEYANSAKISTFYERDSDVEIIKRETCQKDFEPRIDITEEMICALKTAVNRDLARTSGCPLVCEENGASVLHGITTFELNNKEKPVVYTNVASHIQFIQEN